MAKSLDWHEQQQGNSEQKSSLARVLLPAEPNFNQGTPHNIQYLGNSRASEADIPITCLSKFRAG